MSRAHGPPRKISKIYKKIACSWPMGKQILSGMETGQGDFCPTTPDLADILGDMEFDSGNSDILDLSDAKFPDFQLFRYQNSRISRLCAESSKNSKNSRSQHAKRNNENPLCTKYWQGLSR